MSRPVVLTGGILVAFGLALFLVKVFAYGLPALPSDVRGLWQVSLRISVRGDGRRGSVSALLPSSDEEQVVFDERSSSDRLDFSIRSKDGARVGIWAGRIESVHNILYEFRVQSFDVKVDLPGGAGAKPPDTVVREYGRSTPIFPVEAPEVASVLEELNVPATENVVTRVRTVFAFVSHEIANVPSAGDDAVLALAQREASTEGKERLLVTLLRAAGVPARLIRGLELREGAEVRETVWSEAWLDDRWVPLSSVDGFFAERPRGFVVLGDGERPLVEATGASGVGYRLQSLREHLRPDEIAALMAPGNRYLAGLSLYQLPLPTQSALRLILLFPIGALIVTVFRNLVGVPTFGTFMPVLISFALRGTTLAAGLTLVALVLALGVIVRLPLERLRLLLVPRLSIILCVVILTVAALALLGRGREAEDLFAGVLFPIVILTMLVERFSIALAEEGWRQAFTLAGSSVVVAVAVYPAFRSVTAEHLMFSFPELIVSIMGLLVWIGGYTGYRLLDLLRFRVLAAPAPPPEVG